MRKFLIFLFIILVIAGAAFFAYDKYQQNQKNTFDKLKNKAAMQVKSGDYARASNTLNESLNLVDKQSNIEAKVSQISSFIQADNFVKAKNYNDAILSFQKVQTFGRTGGYSLLARRAQDKISQVNHIISQQKKTQEESELIQKKAEQQAQSEAKQKASLSQWTKRYAGPDQIPQMIVDQARINIKNAGMDTNGVPDQELRTMIISAQKANQNIVDYFRHHHKGRH